MTESTFGQVVAIGEILMDLLPEGPRPGGAPANVAWHARRFGADAAILSRVGNDRLGNELLDHLDRSGLPRDWISVDDDHPTGTVKIGVDDSGEPSYTIHRNAAWDFLSPGPADLDLAARADAVCFGTLAQREEVSRRAVRLLLEATRKESLKMFDVNLRQAHHSKEIIETSLKAADALKLNDEELPVLADCLELTGGERERIETLADRHSLRLIALTRGVRGSLLFTREGFEEHPGCAANPVVDTVGAGDCFTAAVIVGFLAGASPAKISERANRAAAFVCEHHGATPMLPKEFAFVKTEG